MKKKILVIIMAAMMAATMVSIIGCTSYQESVDISQENDLFCNGYFTAINKWNYWHSNYYIVYANDTKVKYFITYNGNKFGITPLYNADGTLQVYDGE